MGKEDIAGDHRNEKGLIYYGEEKGTQSGSYVGKPL